MPLDLAEVLLDRGVAEVVAVARARGVRLLPVSGLRPEWLAGGPGTSALLQPLQHALFWLAALASVFLMPGSHLILTEIAWLGLFAL